MIKNPGPKDCIGEEKHTKDCKTIPFNGELNKHLNKLFIKKQFYQFFSVIIEAHTSSNDIHLGALGWSTFVIIILLAVVISCAITSVLKDRKQKKLTAITGSPHYGSYPNQYSSLPTKDVRNMVLKVFTKCCF